jgi:hypothetical protein
MTEGFRQALHADGPAQDRLPQVGLYGFLVGSWSSEIRGFDEDGGEHRGTGEIHAGWVLRGRAIQDVWLLSAPMPVAGNWYGSTLRVFDPTIGAWRIFWNDPSNNRFLQQIGRAHGNDIVQEGGDEHGRRHRWRFTEVTPDAFHWLGEIAVAPDAPWRLRVEVLARRLR